MYYFVLGIMARRLSCELSSSGQTTDEVVILDLNCTERDSEVCLLFFVFFLSLQIWRGHFFQTCSCGT